MLSLNPLLNHKKVPFPIKWRRDHENDTISPLKNYLQQNGYKKILMEFPGITINSAHPTLAHPMMQ